MSGAKSGIPKFESKFKVDRFFSQAPVEQDDMDALIATHRIQRGLSRVSIKKRKANEMSELEKLHLKKRDLQQELKDKNFQLRCIQQLLSTDITNEVS